jgi:hypothetical protein
MPTRGWLSVSIVLALLALPARADERLDRAAEKAREKIASTWLDLARALEGAGAKSAAEDALGRARALAPGLEGLGDVAERVAAIGEDVPPDEAAQRRIEKAREDAAKGYDRLAKVFEGAAGDPRHVRHLLDAIALDPSKARVQRLAALAQEAPLLFQAPGHDFAVWLSIPKAWRPGREWPVLVSVDGAGADFLGNARTFLGARGSRDWITIAAHALSCTNEIDRAKFPAYSREVIDRWNGDRVGFDVPGLLGVLDAVRDLFGGAPKVAITGFSGGGNLCYGFTLRHPDRVLCAAPACANFQPGLARGAARPEAGGPPVHVMTGADDPHRHLTHGKTPPGIEDQTDMAMKAFADQGFTNVKRTMLPGVGHSALPREVWSFVDEVVE